MKVKFIVIISMIMFTGMLCNSPYAFSRKRPLDNEDYEGLPVNVTANRMHYDKKGNILKADGSVEITQGDRRLEADHITMNLVTKDTQARGDVALYQGKDVIFCDSFDINLDTQVGVVYHARVKIKQENIYIQGREIKKTGPNSYNVTKGTITTCEGDSPPWRIDASHIDVTIEGYAVVKHSTFNVKGLPLMYVPWAIFPVKRERQSGFLTPELGHSERLGWAMGNSFFWAISENTDATFWLDTTSRKGFGSGMEYRFRLSDKTRGQLYGYMAHEQDRYYDHVYRDPRDRDKFRGYVHFEGEHYFTDSAYVKAHGSHITDREFYHDYKRVVKRSKGALSKKDCRSFEKDESAVFFTKNWDSSQLVLNVNAYKDLRQSNEYVLQRLPQVIYSTKKLQIGETPLYYQLDSAYDYFWREKGEKGHRVDVFPKISLPMAYNGWLRFNPEFGLRGLSYMDVDEDDDYDTGGVFPSVRAELTATFYKTFTIAGSRIKKLKHTVEPGLLYEYIPYIDQRDYPRFDMPDRFYTRHSVRYYIKNRFTVLSSDNRGGLSEYEIGYFLIGQSFHFTDPSRGIYEWGSRDREFSDIFTEVRFDLLRSLYFKSKCAYSTYSNSLRYYNVLLHWHNEEDEFIELEYRYDRHYFEILDLEGRLCLFKPVYLFFDVRYDYNTSEEFDTEIGFDYSAQCWGFRVSLETDGDTAGRVDDTRINYIFYLKGLGETL